MLALTFRPMFDAGVFPLFRRERVCSPWRKSRKSGNGGIAENEQGVSEWKSGKRRGFAYATAICHPKSYLREFVRARERNQPPPAPRMLTR
jgi:hypothetical protein